MIRLIVGSISLLLMMPGFAQVATYHVGEIHTIQSEVMEEERQIAVFTPPGYDQTTEKYQVLYLLDGEWNFQFVAALTDKLSSSGDMPKMIVVGIINTNRSRDLTPPGVNDNKSRFGGAERFLEFLADELKPWIESTYRTHPYSVLAGHSFGGLFTIYAMLESPDIFQSFIALSPSLGRNSEQQVHIAQEFFREKRSFSKSLYLGIGDEGGYTFSSSRKFSEIVHNNLPDGMRFKFEQLSEENHVSMTVTGFINGLRFINEGYQVEKLEELDEIFLVEAHYDRLSQGYGYRLDVPEGLYQRFVKEQIGEKEYDYALFILGKYAQVYPKSAYLLSYYADVYLLMGDFEKAKEYYLKLSDLGIEDERLSKVLKQLEEE